MTSAGNRNPVNAEGETMGAKAQHASPIKSALDLPIGERNRPLRRPWPVGLQRERSVRCCVLHRSTRPWTPDPLEDRDEAVLAAAMATRGHRGVLRMYVSTASTRTLTSVRPSVIDGSCSLSAMVVSRFSTVLTL
jgi:hypothetical protein